MNHSQLPRPPGDRRVRRSQQLLRHALLELMSEHAWESIAIRDICERADVARSTFYNHFADKEDLLVAGFAELRGHLQEATKATSDALGFLEPLLAHADEHVQVFKALVGRRTAQVVRQHFVDLVGQVLRPWIERPSPLHGDATARFAAGALVETLGWWLEGDRPISRDALRAPLAQALGEVLKNPPPVGEGA